jgi:hypothetical protein
MKVRLLLLAAGLAALAQADEISDCSTLQADEARLKCYDETTQRVVPAEPVPEVEALPAAEPAEDTDSVPEQVFGKSADETSEIIAAATGVEDISEISGRVVAATEDPYGRITVKLDNSQKWKQVRADRFDVDVGDEVVVRKAMLNSFALQLKSGGRKTKVRRVD